jgi:hypothetical protein
MLLHQQMVIIFYSYIIPLTCFDIFGPSSENEYQFKV